MGFRGPRPPEAAETASWPRGESIGAPAAARSAAQSGHGGSRAANEPNRRPETPARSAPRARARARSDRARADPVDRLPERDASGEARRAPLGRRLGRLRPLRGRGAHRDSGRARAALAAPTGLRGDSGHGASDGRVVRPADGEPGAGPRLGARGGGSRGAASRGALLLARVRLRGPPRRRPPLGRLGFGSWPSSHIAARPTRPRPSTRSYSR